LRMGRLAEAWIAPPGLRELRELIRYRAKLVQMRTSCKAQVHAVLAKEGVKVAMSDLFGAGGVAMLDEVDLGEAYAIRVTSLRELIAKLNGEIAMLQGLVDKALAGHSGFEAIQAIGGVGPVLAAVFVAEVGDVTRFADSRHLCSWAGLTPKHHESDVKVRRGRTTKQGSRLVRWAAVEAATRQRGPTPRSRSSVTVSPIAGAKASRRWRPPARFSPWSSTAYATVTYVA
jgi:transposase